MARSSGVAGSGTPRESFSQARFLRYEVLSNPDRVRYLPEVTGTPQEILLRWFIGSGRVGRSYVHAEDGFLFQSPASYFAEVKKWGLSPGYESRNEFDIARPIEYPCLHCHSSFPRLVEGTQNQYASPPFEEHGVACERCHGPGAAHIEQARKGRPGPILQPARLAARERDSICEQCHLTGALRVERKGRRMQDFVPGQDWAEIVATFVRVSQADGPAAATDHAEQFSQSKCKKMAGDRLWCATCHNPHEDRAADRQPCLQCHQKAHAASRATHEDCIACHMPKARTWEGEHVAYTDHSIRRRPAQDRPSLAPRLMAYPGTRPSERDLALARNDPAGLQSAAKQDDPPVLAALAQIHDQRNEPDSALPLYERLLRLDPNHPALANLAIHRVRQGRKEEAARIWSSLIDRYPGLPGPGINLALLQLESGDAAAARRTVEKLLRIHPNLPQGRDLLRQIRP